MVTGEEVKSLQVDKKRLRVGVLFGGPSNEKEISLWEVLNRAQEFGFKGGTLEAIENFVLMIKSFASMLKKSNAYDVAFHVVTF